MSLTHSQLLEHQKAVFADFPTESITITGTTYACLILENEPGNEVTEGGFVDTITLRVAIERSAIDSAIPEVGTLATYNGGSVRIMGVNKKDAASSLELTLEQIT